MNQDCAEHVVVTKHDAEGRILEFVKSPIGLALAEALKAKASLERERKARTALLLESDALLEQTAESDALLDEQAAKRESDALLEQAAKNSTRTVKPKTIDEFIVEASLILSAMRAWAKRDGEQIGKSVMVKWLEPHKDCA